MIMSLPHKYRSSYAEIKKGVLFLYDVSKFNSVMFELTYLSKKSQCIYCKKRLKLSYKSPNRTLDHMYPISIGGVTITDNLAICCSKCNSEKRAMTVQEYIHFLSLPHQAARKYAKQTLSNRESIYNSTGFFLPIEWVEWRKLSSIRNTAFSETRNQLYNKAKTFYEKYGHFSHPIIVDRKGTIINNIATYIYAKDNDIKMVPVIRLENVRFLKR